MKRIDQCGTTGPSVPSDGVDRQEYRGAVCTDRAESTVRLLLFSDDPAVQTSSKTIAATNGWMLEASPNYRPSRASALQFRDQLKYMAAHASDVVLLDWGESLEPVIRHITGILSIATGAAIIVLGSEAEPDLVYQCLSAGAVGFQLKPIFPKQLLLGIQCAAQGTLALCPRAQAALLTCLRRHARLTSLAELSPRERQIAECLYDGLSNKEVSNKLGVEAETVHSFIRRIFKKLGVHTRREAARMLFGPAR